MTNKNIAFNFKLLSQLMEVYGDDSFKIKSYLNAARTIDKLPVELTALPEEKIFSIMGIGKAIGNKIIEQINSGTFKVLEEYILKTPPGIIEMLGIKGLGPKKIITIWNELEIESIGELLYACNENRLMLYKGFGEKTQNNIREAIEFYLASKGSFLFAEIENAAKDFDTFLHQQFSSFRFLSTGAFYKHDTTIEVLDWVTNADEKTITQFVNENNFEIIAHNDTTYTFKTQSNITIRFIYATDEKLVTTAFKHSCSEFFYDAFVHKFPDFESSSFSSEVAIFEKYNIAFIPPYLREAPKWLTQPLPQTIQPDEVKGLIHSHSKWSDGANTLREMAESAKQQGLEYMVISDHSQSAFYAQGLSPQRIKEQHAEIAELNNTLAPFKIFKSIESDILYDGRLDYTDEVLSSFDIVIASIHSILKMTEEKAMERLMNAIKNPFTNILGHMTGRLLLSRAGYPVDHKTIIDTCAENNVVIELNANPRRLDIDWTWIDYAMQKKVLISINPDAHSTKGIGDIRYGVLAAQKAGLTQQQNLSSFTLKEFELFIQNQHKKRL